MGFKRSRSGVTNMAIKDEIELLRKTLNEKISGESSIHSNPELIDLSQKLDKLINVYMQQEFKKVKDSRC